MKSYYKSMCSRNIIIKFRDILQVYKEDEGTQVDLPNGQGWTMDERETIYDDYLAWLDYNDSIGVPNETVL